MTPTQFTLDAVKYTAQEKPETILKISALDLSELITRAETAEARAAETAELLRQAAEVISRLRNERDRAQRDRALRADMIDTLWSEYIKAIKRIVEMEGRIGRASSAINQALH